MTIRLILLHRSSTDALILFQRRQYSPGRGGMVTSAQLNRREPGEFGNRLLARLSLLRRVLGTPSAGKIVLRFSGSSQRRQPAPGSTTISISHFDATDDLWLKMTPRGKLQTAHQARHHQPLQMS